MKYLVDEWKALQQQYDSFEAYSLLIKLLSVTLFVVLVFCQLSFCLGLSILLILWFQDAIWKTFQARAEVRLLIVEKSIADKHEDEALVGEVPCQFNRQFVENRPSTVGLVREYLSQAVRPTVAFPHAVLVLLFSVYSYI